jgi:hypothetical protein
MARDYNIRHSGWVGDQPLLSDGCLGSGENLRHDTDGFHRRADFGRETEKRATTARSNEDQERALGASISSRRAEVRSRTSRQFTLSIAAREYVWWWDFRHGMSAEAIARREGVNLRRIRFGVARAQAQQRKYPLDCRTQPPRLVPFFPIGPYTPLASCGHSLPIEAGSALCCMVCHQSGLDDHPAMRRDPQTDPKPEPKVAVASLENLSLSTRETRRQRRQRLFTTGK